MNQNYIFYQTILIEGKFNWWFVICNEANLLWKFDCLSSEFFPCTFEVLISSKLFSILLLFTELW